MKYYLNIIILTFLLNCASSAKEEFFLSEEKINDAKTLAASSQTCEEFRKEKEEKDCFFTIEDYEFDYKGEKLSFNVAVGFDNDSTWGEIAVYPANVDLKKINYDAKEFNDLGKNSAHYYATLRFEFVPSTETQPSYYILEKIAAAYRSEGRGYSQACVSYFMDRFIKDRTNVKFVFSDARNAACRHFFPRYGLQEGMAEVFKNINFSRPLQVPFYWERPVEK